MSRQPWKVFCLAAICTLATRYPTHGQPVTLQSPEAQTIATATQVLQQFTALKIRSIPQDMLQNAQGVAIIPNVIKVGFVLAGRFGRGVILVRTPEAPGGCPSLAFTAEHRAGKSAPSRPTSCWCSKIDAASIHCFREINLRWC